MHILLIHQAFAALDEAGGTRHYEMASFLAEQKHRVTIIASPVNYLSGKNRNKQTFRPAKEKIHYPASPLSARILIPRCTAVFSTG